MILHRIRWRFEPRDFWVGVYVESGDQLVRVFICLLPMVPIVLSFRRKPR